MRAGGQALAGDGDERIVDQRRDFADDRGDQHIVVIEQPERLGTEGFAEGRSSGISGRGEAARRR